MLIHDRQCLIQSNSVGSGVDVGVGVQVDHLGLGIDRKVSAATQRIVGVDKVKDQIAVHVQEQANAFVHIHSADLDAVTLVGGEEVVRHLTVDGGMAGVCTVQDGTAAGIKLLNLNGIVVEADVVLGVAVEAGGVGILVAQGNGNPVLSALFQICAHIEGEDGIGAEGFLQIAAVGIEEYGITKSADRLFAPVCILRFQQERAHVDDFTGNGAVGNDLLLHNNRPDDLLAAGGQGKLYGVGEVIGCTGLLVAGPAVFQLELQGDLGQVCGGCNNDGNFRAVHDGI